MKLLLVLVAVLAAVNGNDLSVRPGYNYDANDAAIGPGGWSNVAENCNSATVLTQSPINIEKATVNCEYIRELAFENGDQAITTQAANYAHDFKVAFEPVVKISKGGLDDVYIPLLGNLYWGTSETDGSEHSLDGVKAAAELQIYAYGEATNNLHVFVVKYKVGQTDNAGLATYLSTIADYNSIPLNTYAQASVVTTLSGGFKSLLPANARDFYRYEGTVTRPTCTSANYTVFYEQAEISAAQLEALRTIQYETAASVFANGAGRQRPIQETNEREIKGTLGTNEAFLLGNILDIKQFKGDILHNIGDFFGSLFG